MAATGDQFEWQGAAVLLPEGQCDPAMVERTRSLLPVTFGEGAARDLAGRCDVIVSWVLRDLEPILGGITPRPKVIYIDHFPHDAVYDDAARWCLRSADHIVGVSELCEPGFPPEFAGRTSVIWNALDWDRIADRGDKAALRAAWGVPANAPVAGFYSRIDPQKRPDAMVRLAASLPAPWHVVLVGCRKSRPAEVARLDGLISSLPPEVRGRVHALDADNRAGAVLRAFDVLVVPAEVESFGLSMAEGIAIGVPVVSTAVGLAAINPDLTRIVPLDASGAKLAAAVRAALKFGPRRGAREYVLHRAGLERFGGEWATLIERLATQSDPTRLWMAVDLCEHGSGPCGCGGGPPRVCSHPDHPGLVRRGQCFECVSRRLAA